MFASNFRNLFQLFLVLLLFILICRKRAPENKGGFLSGVCVRARACVRACVRVCVHVCVCERETHTQRQTETETESVGKRVQVGDCGGKGCD